MYTIAIYLASDVKDRDINGCIPINANHLKRFNNIQKAWLKVLFFILTDMNRGVKGKYVYAIAQNNVGVIQII